VTAWRALYLPLGWEILVIPVAKGHWVIPRTARSAARKLFLLRSSDYIALLATHEISLCAGPLVSCLSAVIFFASPGGALRPGLVPAGWGALGRCLLARFGGETAPPLVQHPIGLKAVGSTDQLRQQ
jgi:hypothetical protein